MRVAISILPIFCLILLRAVLKMTPRSPSMADGLWTMHFSTHLWKSCQAPSALTKVTTSDTKALPRQNIHPNLAVNPLRLGILNL